MAITEQAPYAPTASVVKALDTYRETGLGGGPITPPLLARLSMGEEIARRVALSLKLLGLIDDDGQATPSLLKFKQAGSSEYKPLLAEILYEVYDPVFAVIGRDPSKKSPHEIEDAFRAFRPDSLRKRMVTLFLGLCEYAEIIEASPARTQTTSSRSRSVGNGKQSKQAEGRNHRAKEQPSASPDSRPTAPAGPTAGDSLHRYLDVLIARAESSQELDPALLDRIERALGIVGAQDDQ